MENSEKREDVSKLENDAAEFAQSEGANFTPPEVNDDSSSWAGRYRKYLTVEPYMFLVCFAMAVRMQVNTALNMQKVCVNSMNHSYDLCLAINDTHPDYNAIQQAATDITIASVIVSTIPSVVMGVLIGSFCDKYGRKVPMMLAPIGSIVEMVGMLACVIYFESPTWWIIVCNFPGGLTGGMMVSMSAVYSYITEVATVKSRPMRFAIVEMTFIVGFTSGTALGGFIFKMLGFFPIYLISMIVNMLAIIHLYFALEENHRLTKGMTYGEIARAVCSLDSVRASVRAVAKKRPGNARAQVVLLILAMTLALMPMIGTGSISLYYVHKRYNWQVDTYSYLSTVSKIVSSITTALTVRLLTKHWHVHHLCVALIGLFSQMFEYAIRGLSEFPWMFVASYAVGCVGGCMSVGMRSRLSGHLAQDEIGKIFVLLSIVEMNTPILAMSLFGWIYRSTLTYAMGTVYLVASGLFVIPIIINIIIIIWGTAPVQRELRPRTSSVSSIALN